MRKESRLQQRLRATSWEQRISLIVIVLSLVIVAVAYATRPEPPASTLEQRAVTPPCEGVPTSSLERDGGIRCSAGTEVVQLAQMPARLAFAGARIEAADVEMRRDAASGPVLSVELGFEEPGVELRPFLRIGDERVAGEPTRVGPGGQRVIFALSDADAATVTDDKAAEIGFRPVGAAASDKRLGVLRVDVPRVTTG